MVERLPDWEGKIEALTQEGLGVGNFEVEENGKKFTRPIFIPFTVPGDTISAKIKESKGKYNFGELERVIEPSENRIEPRCPHFTICGGCNLQHVKYETQLGEKARQIKYLLERKGITIPENIKVWPSRKLHKYRWRARVAVGFGQGIRAGFRKAHSREIVKINQCYIVAGEVMEFIELLNQQKSEPKETEVEITVVTGQKQKVGILVHLDKTKETEYLKEFFSNLYANNRKLIGNLFFEQNDQVKTIGQVQEHITYPLGDMEFMFLPETFIQANILTNDLLVKRATELLFKDQDPRDAVVLDLYAGIGNFSLPIARMCKEVIAVEGQKSSVLAGEANALRNKVDNVKFVHSPTGKFLGKYRKKSSKASHAIIDPPRTGVSDKAMKDLLGSEIPRIVYVSCNPISLSKDLLKLKERYDITEILGVDMFPDVSHVEVVVLLDKK